MTLYHGSLEKVEKPAILEPNRTMDYGKGFYTTTSKDQADKWAENFAENTGKNKNDIKTYLADQQNLLTGFGATRKEGAKLSEQMTQAALDLASFNNANDDDAVRNMTKACMGDAV